MNVPQRASAGGCPRGGTAGGRGYTGGLSGLAGARWVHAPAGFAKIHGSVPSVRALSARMFCPGRLRTTLSETVTREMKTPR